VPEGGTVITKAEVKYLPYTHATWTYDAAQNVWYRVHNEAPHMDAVTGEQLHFDNVVIIESEHWLQPYNYEEYWGYENYAYSTNFICSGRVFCCVMGCISQANGGVKRAKTRSNFLIWTGTR
jgi:hypothetical protein